MRAAPFLKLGSRKGDPEIAQTCLSLEDWRRLKSKNDPQITPVK